MTAGDAHLFLEYIRAAVDLQEADSLGDAPAEAFEPFRAEIGYTVGLFPERP
jgi:hypothetical protein